MTEIANLRVMECGVKVKGVFALGRRLTPRRVKRQCEEIVDAGQGIAACCVLALAEPAISALPEHSWEAIRFPAS